MVDGQQSVRQAILLLLTTEPGERIRRPTYGCELHRLVFSPNDDTTAGLAIHFVRQALIRWEPRIDILKLDATRSDGSPEKLEILLEYRVKMTGQIDMLIYQLDLVGERP
jgi:phage baseplate assembly protein W